MRSIHATEYHLAMKKEMLPCSSMEEPCRCRKTHAV